MGDRASARTRTQPTARGVASSVIGKDQCVFCEEDIRPNEPMCSTGCGHTLCSTCADELSNGASKCPLDGSIVHRNTIKILPPKAEVGQQREILFRCPNKDKCDQLLPMDLIQEHLVKCLQSGQAKPVQPTSVVGPAIKQMTAEVSQPSKVIMRAQPTGSQPKRRPLSMTSADMALASMGEQRQQIEFLRDSILTVELRVDRMLQVLKDGMTGIQDSSNNVKVQLNDKIEKLDNEMKIFGNQMTQLTNQMKEISENFNIKRDLPVVEEEVSYDGVLVWRIDGYSQLKAQGLKSSVDLCSPAFYTNRYGYKMCLALDTLGDGIGRGTHISIYLCVMRGRYDDVLNWPFQQKVTFVLMDQKETRDKMHLMKTLVPDFNWPELGKPKSEKNIGRGFHRFVSHDVIEAPESRYLVNDAIYIKAIVDDSIIL